MIQAIQLILALSFLVLIHELGHFTFAKIFKVRVEKFYLFFNPKISLVRFKHFDGKWHVKFLAKNEDKEWESHPETTEWGIGWLPFGGYCAISGMVDETHSTDDLASEPQPWEFRSKPAWQRLLIILGGILVNFIGALVIFTMLFWHWGNVTLPLRNVTTGLYYSDIMQAEGFEQQDKILTIDGVEPETLTDAVQAMIIEGKRNVTVLRGTDTIQLLLSEDLGTRYLAQQNAFDKIERASCAMPQKGIHKRKKIPIVCLIFINEFVQDGYCKFSEVFVSVLSGRSPIFLPTTKVIFSPCLMGVPCAMECPLYKTSSTTFSYGLGFSITRSNTKPCDSIMICACLNDRSLSSSILIVGGSAAATVRYTLRPRFTFSPG